MAATLVTQRRHNLLEVFLVVGPSNHPQNYPMPLLCNKLCLGRPNIHIYSIVLKKPMTEQITASNNVQPGEPMSVLVLTYRNMGKELLTAAEMTQRKLHHQGLPQLL